MTNAQILANELIICDISIKYCIAYKSGKYVEFRDTQKTLLNNK